MGLLTALEKKLIRHLIKGSRKQPWMILFLVLLVSGKRNPPRKQEPERDEQYWRTIGGL